jgi:DNA-nicking Smr family endonuclease
MNPKEFQFEWLKRHPVSIHLKFDPLPSSGPHRGIKPARKKVPKVRKGRPFREKAVDEELDLHGFAIDEGLVEIDIFLDMARKYKLACVRVVHGMGPEHGPSLRKAIRRYLATLGKSRVDRLETEPHNAGAVIIYPKIR